MADPKISSPCVSICEVEDGRCIGCGRTQAEISDWREYTEDQRLAIMDRLEQEAANGGWFAADAFDAAPGAPAAPVAPAASAAPATPATPAAPAASADTTEPNPSA